MLYKLYHHNAFAKAMRDYRRVLYARRLKRMEEVIVSVTHRRRV